MTYKIREFKDKNYRGIYFNGKTMRIALNPKEPIQDLDYPEFMDIKLNSVCNGGCSYCYQDSTESCGDGADSLDKLIKFFSSMDSNQKPFQIAYGGGEPTLNPNFCEIMRMTREDFDIAPNYTTNGLFLSQMSHDKAIEVLEATKKYCEGVAITCHDHLYEQWELAAKVFTESGIFTNLHIIINDEESVDEFLYIYRKWKGKIKYFVLLPLIADGRASDADISKDYEYLFSCIKELKLEDEISDIAFGAMFHPYLHDKQFLNLSLYEPEIMSKYLDLETCLLYKSSFDTKNPIRKLELED